MLRMIRSLGIGNEADTLVNIAEKEIPFFFVNDLNQPCVVAKVQQHYEVMEIGDDQFLGVLRSIWRNNNTGRITISEGTLKRARDL